jgi:hypothetical protein
VDISDRKPRQDGYWFPLLASINQGVEEKVDFAHDHWSSVGAWSFYQAMVSYADEMYKAGHRTLSPASMPLALFDDRVRSNLRASGFEEQARSYERL